MSNSRRPELPDIADARWYEWTVGQLYVVEMLDPDSEITAVTFQKSAFSPLDDVVVERRSANTRGIQVKHTRAANTLTFGDIVADGDGKSLLAELGEAWWAARRRGLECDVELLTNRAYGSRTARSQAGVQRPPLGAFWAHIQRHIAAAIAHQRQRHLCPRYRVSRPHAEPVRAKGQARTAPRHARLRMRRRHASAPRRSLAALLQIPAAWRAAWHEWESALQGLPMAARLEFLRSLTIRANQPDLDQLETNLLDKIRRYIGTTNPRPLLHRLDSALRTWTTTRRGTSEHVDRERLFEALSLSVSESVGDHDLAPPAPFFPSRQTLANELETRLLGGEHRVVFLTGRPGCGKSSVVSYLATRRAPVLDLRFFAFRPITPDNPLLPADAGQTVEPRALWGDLLCQLRELLRGRLAAHNVPVSNEFLSVDRLRAEVLRLAQAVSDDRDSRPVVIAIDGIDHAARAAQPGRQFLTTLPPPDTIPPGVVLLIAGQPPEAYPEYPAWIQAGDSRVCRQTVPNLTMHDVESLVAAECEWLAAPDVAAAARIVMAAASGNTLSAVFAVREVARADDLEEAQRRLHERRLADGIETYYESIWRATTGRDRPEAIGVRLAACLALAGEKLTGDTLADAFSDAGVTADGWAGYLRRLQPLVDEDDHGFAVAHNDVRVFFGRVLGARDRDVVDVASRLADHYLRSLECREARHRSLFDLLRRAGREAEIPRHFTPDYVLEAWAIGRSMHEILGQAQDALDVVARTRDWDLVHQLVCTLQTVTQLRSCLQWSQQDLEQQQQELHRALPPPLMPSEARTPRGALLVDALRAVTLDASRLVASGELERASALLSRALPTLDPVVLARSLPRDQVEAENRAVGDGYVRQEVADAARMLGSCTWRCCLPSRGACAQDNVERSTEAHFFGGQLDAALDHGGLALARLLRRRRTHWPSDLDDVVARCVAEHRWKDVVNTLWLLRDGRAQIPFRVQAAALAVALGHERLTSVWAHSVAQSGFDLIADLDGYANPIDRLFCSVAFVLGALRPNRPAEGIRDDGIEAYFSKLRDERKQPALSTLLLASAWTGRALALARSDSARATTDVSEAELRGLLSVLLFPDDRAWWHINDAPQIVADIVACLSRFGELTGAPHHHAIVDRFVEFATQQRTDPCSVWIWQYLEGVGHQTILSGWFDSVAGPEATTWELDVASRNSILDRFTPLAGSAGLDAALIRADETRRWMQTGYTGEKEYALGRPLSYFAALASATPECWFDHGCRLLGLSRRADTAGDNRFASDIARRVLAAAARHSVPAFERLVGARTAEAQTWFDEADWSNAVSALCEFVDDGCVERHDLLVLWCLGTGLLAWQDDNERQHIVDLRDSVLNAAQRKGFEDLAADLSQLAPLESAVPARGSSTSEAPESTGSLHAEVADTRIDHAVQRLITGIHESREPGTSAWRKAAQVVSERLAKERPLHVERYADEILTRVVEYQPRFGWRFDGRENIVSTLHGLASSDRRWWLVEHAIANLDYADSPDLWLQTIEDKLNVLSLSVARQDGAARLTPWLTRMCDMHESWLTGGGRLQQVPVPVLADGTSETWGQLACRLLTRRVGAQHASLAASALRGLWSLLQVEPETAARLVDIRQSLGRSTLRRLMHVVERVANTDLYVPFETLVLESWKGDDFDLRAAAWIVMAARERLGGEPTPAWPRSSPTNQDVGLGRGGPLIYVEGSRSGAMREVHGLAAANSLLRQVEGTTGMDVGILGRRVAPLLEHEVADVDNPPRGRRGDMLLTDGRAARAVRRAVGEMLSEGYFDGVPLVRVLQAVTPSDECRVLLRTSPLSAFEAWPADGEIDNATHSELTSCLSNVVCSELGPEDVVLGAIAFVYGEKLDVVFEYWRTLHHGSLLLPGADGVTTLNGRAFALYHDDRFEPPNRSRSIVLFSGGVGDFWHQSMLCYPTLRWSRDFGWRPLPDDPFRWVDENGVEVARYEATSGPVRSRYPYRFDRQPLFRRWVATAAAVADAEQRTGASLLVRREISATPARG
ncbi:MAG: ATP-binding protein [Myxococcales bacterium]|nr:ATP-binding protein [Myxococcales bacterium]